MRGTGTCRCCENNRKLVAVLLIDSTRLSTRSAVGAAVLTVQPVEAIKVLKLLLLGVIT